MGQASMENSEHFVGGVTDVTVWVRTEAHRRNAAVNKPGAAWAWATAMT
jgi:hypothetical protein